MVIYKIRGKKYITSNKEIKKKLEKRTYSGISMIQSRLIQIFQKFWPKFISLQGPKLGCYEQPFAPHNDTNNRAATLLRHFAMTLSLIKKKRKKKTYALCSITKHVGCFQTPCNFIRSWQSHATQSCCISKDWRYSLPWQPSLYYTSFIIFAFLCSREATQYCVPHRFSYLAQIMSQSPSGSR